MSSSTSESVSEQPDARRANAVELPISYATYVDRWAIVVGVSQYKHARLNLKYAHRDAQELYDLLLTPTGGGFEEEKVIKLIDEEATTANITRALRSFLKKPAKEDIVVLYFACHGAPDIDRPEILYLLTHDTDPADISGTALPMREINLSIQENLLAERVVIIADTCHSAGLSSTGTREVGDSSGSINLYLKEAATAKKGVALLTSAEANQVSFEDKKWGGGHGVFTHYLLEGMRGAADNNPKNGIVTVGELFEYVREKVKDATGTQHPCVGTGSYDRNLPMAITAGISAQEHYELGCELYQIGLKLADQHCFEAASRHLRESIRQSAMVKRERPDAYLHLGLSSTASGNLPEEGVAAFSKAIAAEVPEADYHLGLAYFNEGNTEAAKEHLKAFIEKDPSSNKSGAVGELISWMEPSNSENEKGASYHAFLIGINYSKNPSMPTLRGCVNDIEILGDVLSQKYNCNISLLADMEATYENIIHGFHELQTQTHPRDVVVIYYGGCSDGDNLLAADTKKNDVDERLNIIKLENLYSLIEDIPALRVHLIMDTEVNTEFQDFIERMQRTKIATVFLGASLGQSAREIVIDDKSYGCFTSTLVEHLWKASANQSQKKFLEQVRKDVNSKFPTQVPCYIGDIDKTVFFSQPDLDQWLELFTFSWQRYYLSHSRQSLQLLHQNVERQFTNTLPDFYYSLGLAFLEKGSDAEALNSLKSVFDYDNKYVDEKLFSLGKAQLKNKLYADAKQSFQKYSREFDLNVGKEILNDVIAGIDNLEASRQYALIIGIDNYQNVDSITSTDSSTPVEDAKSFAKILVERGNFQSDDIQVLLDEAATRKNIMEAFHALLDKAPENFILFYFAGKGSVDSQENPTILAFDSRSLNVQDIGLYEFSHFAKQKTTGLMSIIDSSWTMALPGSNRYSYPDKNNHFAARDIWIDAIAREKIKIPQIGDISIYPASIRYEEGSSVSPKELTTDLIQLLSENQVSTSNYRQLFSFLENSSDNSTSDERPFINHHLSNLGSPIFTNHVLESRLEALLTKFEQLPINHASLILQRLIEQRSGAAPEEHLSLGIIYYVLHEYDKSIRAIQDSIDQVSASESADVAGQQSSQTLYPEAYYWLGRVLYESKSDPARAVSELRLATQQAPDKVVAYYYLGQALRVLAEQEILTEAERSFQKYLEGGAPLGQREDIQDFLKSNEESVSTR